MEEFDWVTARSQCSVDVVFERLKSEVEADVAIRHGQLPAPPAPVLFDFKFDAAGRIFSVILIGHHLRHVVKFELARGEIAVTFDDEVLLKGRPTICNDGKCRLRVAGAELDLWQFRRLALERLFFEKAGEDA